MAFVGKSGRPQKASIQNAYSAVLQHLETERFIEIDDYNASNVERLKREAFESDSWAMLFQSKVASLKKSIDKQNACLQEFMTTFGSVCLDVSVVAAPKKDHAPSKKRRRGHAISKEDKDRQAALTTIAKVMSDLNEQLRTIAENKIA